MQSVAGVVVIPHRTTDTRCSAGKVAIAGVSAEDKKPTSPCKPSTEDKKKSCIQPGSGQQDEAKSNCTKPPATNHLRDLFISLDKVPIVLSSSHTTPPVAPKSTRLIQDGDRYIFLVEDTRGTKVSSVPVGTPASATKGTDEGTETEGGNQEEGEEETDFSDGGSEGSLEEVRQHHRIIKTQKQDDPDYLTLFEAHQRRLEDTGSPTQGFQTAEVHYVEGPSDPAIYPNGTQANAYHYNDATMFAQQTAAPYIDASQQQQNFTSVTAPGAVTSGQTGFIQVTPAGAAMQSQRHPITHTTRASPATVQWLVDNYETAEGVSLPRSTLYNHYLQHCQANKLDAVNAASFGKLIRSVFMGLRTRRLGTRGNSKYHYYGIRIKPSSPLNALSDESQVAMRQSPSTQKRLKPATRLDSSETGDAATQSTAVSADQQAQQSQMQQHQQYLGDVTQGLPEFDELDLKGIPPPENITEQDLDTFVDMYREHCEAFLDMVVSLQFNLVESLWQTFWRHQSSDNKSAHGDDDEGNKDTCDDGEYESRLAQSKLLQLCEYDPIITFVKGCDQVLYQTLVEVLVPDVLRPIPASLTQAVRNFAKGLESWLQNSLDQIPKKMADVKVTSCGAFAQTLRRYTSLNHLAQAARAVLQNSSQITQMLADLNRVDFANVQEQASWVCQCDDSVVYRLEQDFKLTLQQQNSLEQWASWLEGVVDQVLKQHEGTDEFPKAARQFLLKWSFYSSMIIRDLTLRSAASFGSFHLIRLLYDEYMFYLVEHKVAKAIGASPMAVMGEFVGLGSALSMDLDTVDGNLLAEQPDLTYGTTTAGSAASTSTRTSGTGSLEPEAKRPRAS